MPRGRGGWTKCPCDNCQRDNCGRCSPCLDKKRFGGEGRRNRKCVERYCLLAEPKQQRKSGKTSSSNSSSILPFVVAPGGKQEKLLPKKGGSTTTAVSQPSNEEKPAPSRKTTTAQPPPKRRRCGTCPACLAPDCRKCIYCTAKIKYGGDGSSKSHSSCIERNCHMLYPRVLPNGLRGRARKQIANDQARRSKRPKKRKFADSSSSEMSFDSYYGSNNNDDDDDYGDHDADGSDTRRATTRRKANNADRMDTDSMDDAYDNAFYLEEEPSAASMQKNDPATLQEDAPQSLTSYIEETPVVAPTTDKPGRLPTPYGLEIPDELAPNVCSGCLGARDEELESQPVLLCDGKGCSREYHLACCVPSLSQVPPESDRWLCQDCCPEGSTALLRKYLEAADSAKAEYFSENEGASGEDYIQHLLKKDTADANVDNTNRCPESELARGNMTHSLALCDSKHLARTRRGNENREPLPAHEYLGKPVRIYSSPGNQYHTGRIIEYRVPSAAASNTEFLVRFSAGKDDRKTAHQHWIVLEEHSLAVGTTLVWAQIPPGNWTPAILWLRTSRELIPVQHLLNETEGEIVYKHFEGKTPISNALSPSKTKHKRFSLARNFGAPEQFSLINVRDQCVDLNEAEGTVPKKFLEDPVNTLRFQMAKAEDLEQRRVCSFRVMKLQNPLAPFALSSRDSYTLPLLTSGDGTKSDEKVNEALHRGRASLCPNIRRGLDRTKIVKMLKRRGLRPSKDVAASLACEVVPVTPKIMALKKS